MYFQIETVLEQYGLEDARVSKGRQVLLCEREGRLYALKEYRGSEKKAEQLCLLGQFLQEQGFLADGLLKTREGRNIAQGMDGVNYTLHRWYRGRECSLASRNEMILAVKTLGVFHLLLRQFGQQYRESQMEKATGMEEDASAVVQREAYVLAESPAEEYQRHNRELRKIAQFVVKRKQKSPYESLFLAHYRDFYEKGCLLVEELAQRQVGLPKEGVQLCHGDYNHHNVQLLAGRPAVLNLEKMNWGLQIFDLCTFLRKVLEKHAWETGLGMALWQEYASVCPVDTDGFWQMYYRLAYPEKFWKLANRYYVSNKAWIPHQSYEKLQRELGQTPQRQRFLEVLKESGEPR